MDKIEKIKKWVKKQKKEELVRNSIGVITGQAFFVDAGELLSFLDTFSEEPNKSLEEEEGKVAGRDFVPVDWVETLEMYGKWKIVQAEERPEPYTGKYDEAYIQEKIEKATKSWEGVDVNKYMDEVRGRGEKDTPELEGEAEEWAENEAYGKSDAEFEMAYKGFIAGAEWQEKQDLRWAGEIHKNGYNLCKEKMLKDAIPFYKILKAVPFFERKNTRVIIVNEEE